MFLRHKRRFITILCLLCLVFSSCLVFISPAQAAYRDVLSPISGSYKATGSLTSADKADNHQKNYQTKLNSSGGVEDNFLIETAEWTDIDSGKATITLQGAYLNIQEEYDRPAYFLTSCDAHLFSKDIFYRNVKTLLTMYDEIDVIDIESNRGVGELKTFTSSSTDAEIRNYCYNTAPWGSGINHWTLNVPAMMRNYIFGDLTSPCVDANARRHPAAIYTTFDSFNQNMSEGVLGYLYTAATPDFFQYLVDNYVTGYKRYFSMSQPNMAITSTGAGDGLDIMCGLYNPENFGKPGTFKADYSYDQSFDQVGIRKVPDGIITTDINDVFNILDVTATYSRGAVEKEVDGNHIEVCVPEYESNELITIKANVQVKDREDESLEEWFNVTSGSTLRKLGNEINSVDPTKLSLPPLAPTLSITKVVKKSFAQITDIVEYEINVSNAGPGPARELKLTDILPDALGVEGEVSTSRGFVSVSGQTITITLDDELAKDESMKITYKTKVKETASLGNVVNKATVSALRSDPKTVSSTLKIVGPKLSITKTADNPTYQIDDTIKYTVVVTNIEPDTVARNTKVTDTLPANIILQDGITSTKGSPSYDKARNSWNLNIGDLAYNEKVAITYSAIVGKEAIAATYKNIAKAAADYTDDVQIENSIKVLAPVLSIEKESQESTVQNDDEIHYDINVKNTGDGQARNLLITDAIPSSLDIVADSIAMDFYKISGGSENADLTFNTAIESDILKVTLNKPLPANTGIILHFIAVVKHDIPAGNIINTAEVSADNVSVINDDDTIRLIAPALSISKVSEETIVQNDDPVHYTISVENFGEGEARKLVIRDPIPSETTLDPDSIGIQYFDIDGNPSPYVIDSNIVEAAENIEIAFTQPLLSNTRVDIHFTVIVNGDIPPCMITNTAYAIADTLDEINNSDNTVQVVAPELKITKTSSANGVQIGDVVPYKIIVQNFGEGQARHVLVEDDVPQEFALVPGSLKYEETDLLVIDEDGKIDAVIPGFDGSDDGIEWEDNGWNGKDDVEDNTDESFSQDDSALLPNDDGYNLFSVYSNTVMSDDVDEQENLEGIDEEDNGETDENISDDGNTSNEFNVEGNKWTLTLDHPLSSQKQIAITFDTIVNEVPKGTIKNVSTTTADHVDILTAEDALIDTCDVEIYEPELEIVKTVDKEFAQADDIISYAITVSNKGNGEARHFTLTDIIPDLVEISGEVHSSIEEANIIVADKQINIGLDALPAESNIIITYSAKILPSVKMGDEIINIANTSADYCEEISASASTWALIPGLNIIKTADIDHGMPGENFNYTINVIQNGDEGSIEHNLVVSDTLPDDIMFVGSPSIVDGDYPTGTVNDNVYTLNIEQLAQGESIRINLPVKAGNNVEGKTITNIAYLSSDETPNLQSEAVVEFGIFEVEDEIVTTVPQQVPVPTPQAIPQLPRTGEIILISGLLIVFFGSMAYVIVKERQRKKK